MDIVPWFGGTVGTGSGYGYGDGYGTGYGTGYGSGKSDDDDNDGLLQSQEGWTSDYGYDAGAGHGYGNGAHSGDGEGHGSGYGSGYVYGDGSGFSDDDSGLLKSQTGKAIREYCEESLSKRRTRQDRIQGSQEGMLSQLILAGVLKEEALELLASKGFLWHLHLPWQDATLCGISSLTCALTMDLDETNCSMCKQMGAQITTFTPR